ncbi:MAG TPA: hypothetical protein VKU01_11810 [Bryobacteraceae bacterium]|nr:hypothetical protein [Bryobacteraceae bacterium]
MPYCCKCGKTVGDQDLFCAVCGAKQPVAAGSPANYFTGVSSRTSALLCYIPIVGWIAAIVVLASARFRNDHTVRFHAFQGLYIFVAWLIVDWVVSPMFHVTFFMPGFPMSRILPAILKLLVFGSWIFMMIKVSHDENFKLPLLGELAERSVSEQR